MQAHRGSQRCVSARCAGPRHRCSARRPRLRGASTPAAHRLTAAATLCNIDKTSWVLTWRTASRGCFPRQILGRSVRVSPGANARTASPEHCRDRCVRCRFLSRLATQDGSMLDKEQYLFIVCKLISYRNYRLLWD